MLTLIILDTLGVCVSVLQFFMDTVVNGDHTVLADVVAMHYIGRCYANRFITSFCQMLLPHNIVVLCGRCYGLVHLASGNLPLHCGHHLPQCPQNTAGYTNTQGVKNYYYDQ